jgi:peptidylprolyl isomerase
MSPYVRVVGDLNADGKVGLDDLVLLDNAYGSKLGDSNWNPLADIAPPIGIIGLPDLVTLAIHYGQQFNGFSDKVLLETNMGNITILLFDDMPITTGNFKNLVRTGVYDGTNFSRIVPGFVIQGGDATPKGITVPPIQDELPNKHSNLRGYVAMAKTWQPNSATDQFYTNLNDSNAASLDSNYSVFGMVISGMNVVDAISNLVPSSANPAYYDGPPLTPVTIITAQFVS